MSFYRWQVNGVKFWKKQNSYMSPEKYTNRKEENAYK